jgi:hypothetical protein
MPSRRSSLVIAATVPLLAAAVAVIGVLAASGDATNSANQSATSTQPADPSSFNPIPPVVVSLKDDLVLISHSAAEASTDFGPGILIVSMPVEEDSFRWLEGAAPASGGRIEPTSAMLSTIPANLPVVLTYDVAGKPVSIFARLYTSPVLSGDSILYELSIYDAPGRDSTYTVSGSYDIPPTLQLATLTISGQVVAAE